MKNVSAMPIDVERVAAIDGRLIEPATYDELARLGLPGERLLTGAELGCLLSHRKAWEQVLRSGDNWAFVAEDDINFSRNAAAFFLTDSWIPPGSDIIKAETNLERQRLSCKAESVFLKHKVSRLLSAHDRSGGYFISRAAAAKMIEFSKRHFTPVDVIIFGRNSNRYHQLSVFQILPAICIQDELLDERPAHERLRSTIDDDGARSAKTVKHALSERAKIAREVRRFPSQTMRLIIRFKRYICREEIVVEIPFGHT